MWRLHIIIYDLNLWLIVDHYSLYYLQTYLDSYRLIEWLFVYNENFLVPMYFFPKYIMFGY